MPTTAYLHRRAGLLLCAGILAGCTSTPYQLLSDSHLDGEGVSVVYVPSPEAVYFEAQWQGGRYPPVERRAGTRMLTAMAAGGRVGTRADYNTAPATAADAVIVAFVPMWPVMKYLWTHNRE